MKKQIFKISLLLTIFFMAPTFALAAPTLSGYSGVASDGSSITLSGASFGVNAAVGTSNLEFLGGKNGPIESGTVGNSISRPQWSVMGDWLGDMIYSTDNALFGTKVLKMTDGGFEWPEAPLSYKFPSAVAASGDHLFLSYWERVTWAGNGQYKMLRLSPTNTVIDDASQIGYFFHNNAGWILFGHPGQAGSLYPAFSPADPQGVWARVDLDISTSASATGVVNFTKYLPGDAVQTDNNAGWRTNSSGNNWNYIIWQNYFGTDGIGTMTAGTVWLDDIFIQHGTPARVELCDSVTWANRQQCMIQPPTAWTASSVGITLNAGNFAEGSTKYLYLLDSAGAVSNSLTVIIGGGASDTTAPAAPTGLLVL